jgi:hypothetical protein
MNPITNAVKFKGEMESYLRNGQHHLDSSIDVGRSVLGYCIVTLGILTGHGFYPIDFAYYFSKKRNAKTPFTIGDPRSNSGQRSFEAEHYTKLELACMLLERAVNSGILPGYVLFDSWYSWPVLINRDNVYKMDTV